MPSIRVGTSGWAYSAWKPDFYPQKLASKNFLNFYASQLNAVEVNFTFRRFLTEKMISGWLEQTPPKFHFVVKAHQVLTHIKRLKEVDETMKRFVESLAPLEQAHRLGPVLFQLPPNFKSDPERLGGALALLPRTFRAAFEFRHESWFSEETYKVLRAYNAALCIAETDELKTPQEFTADFGYFRLRKSDYSAEERKGIAERMKALPGSLKEAYAFFKHEERPEAPLWARELGQAVGTNYIF